MNKIINYILLFFLFLLSNCAYEPILSNKNYHFSINANKINGNQKINSIIVDNFYNLTRFFSKGHLKNRLDKILKNLYFLIVYLIFHYNFLALMCVQQH